ncbi:hypothetical protein ASE00_05015 [Sphingomonas sp. Root710]|uniref:hypothetical protein n=1 Tax=Sphingomonas sp. Root710 TaxID=1736594 RepID=UPI0006F5E651|nr:hypothetical protein [Sphingomonas sp. Root710]KRB86103.1 hypothetical protein ASE00_05015 [Sphingomonas sp. Root710]
MTYNRQFEHFVDNDPNKVRGYVAYGLYKESKRQWIQQQTAANGGTPPTVAEVESHVSSYTPALKDSLINSAESVLAAFADEAISAAKPGIVEATLRGSTANTIWLGILTNTIYTLLLVALVLVLKFAGVDILGILGTAA